MAFVPVPGVVSCAIRATLYEKPIQTDFNFLCDTTISGTLLEEIVLGLIVFWQTNALLLLPAPYRLISVYGYDAGQQEGLARDETPEGQTVGQYPGIPMPANVSLFFNSRVGTRKRGNSGGIYWPCFVETDVSENTVSAGIVTPILSMLNELATPDTIAVNTRLCAVSKYLNNAERPAGIARPITTWVANDRVIDSMRRRLPKRNS